MGVRFKRDTTRKRMCIEVLISAIYGLVGLSIYTLLSRLHFVTSESFPAQALRQNAHIYLIL